MINVKQYERNQLRKIQSQNNFLCPHCKGKVYLKIGTIKQPHFAHASSKTCISNPYGEGDYHKKGKKLIYNWLKNQGLQVYLEKWLGEIKRRPDIYVEIGNTKLVLEYQCSEIDKNELLYRMNLYKQLNIKQIWILGGNMFKRLGTSSLRINQFMRNFIHQFEADTSPIIYFFCPTAQHFAIIEHLYHISVNKAYAQIQFLRMEQVSLLDLFKRSSLQITRLTNVWIDEKMKFRLHKKVELKRRTDWRNFLYNHSAHETTLPSYIYLPTKYSFIMNEPAWYWQSQIALRLIEPNHKFSLNSCQQLLKEKVLHKPPLMKQVKNPVKLYIDLLIKIGVINEISTNIYQKRYQENSNYQIERMLQEDKAILNNLFV